MSDNDFAVKCAFKGTAEASTIKMETFSSKTAAMTTPKQDQYVRLADVLAVVATTFNPCATLLEGQKLQEALDAIRALPSTPTDEVSTTRLRWVNIYPDSEGSPQKHRSISDEVAEPARIACVCVPITFAPGEGLGETALAQYQARKGVAAKAGPSKRMSHCSVHGVDYAKASGCSLCHKARKGER